MALRELEYQSRVLRRIGEYLDALKSEKAAADLVADLARRNPGRRIPIPDFAEQAWEVLRATNTLPASRMGIPYSPRRDKIGNPVPNIVLKVPTGGGKTYLAALALERIISSYLGKDNGFVLWVVPNEAIYSQTWAQLNDRQHPYRQVLDRLSANRVRMMEKDTPLNARDVKEGLCVMLLMLQAANRETRESLKMFQDRGDVHGFFPPEGDQEAHSKSIEATPNLDRYDLAETQVQWPMVKDSLGNALRLIRPVIVMDEGHRAVSDLAFETLYGFNPCFVLELTATPTDVAARTGRSPRPARYANILAEVRGVDLDREGMIKMPLNVDPRQGTDWRATLGAALQRLNGLEAEAQRYRAEGGKYIRPIMLVQVERTGSDQRDGHRVHALDVKDWLVRAGLDEAEIAIKTAETNDLRNPENQNLLEPTNRIRAIITKQALQEGWDCSFAYVLCALAASSDESSMTQLVGRILRQPHAERTGWASLDECYIVTHHAQTASVVSAIKAGLESDGLGDLVRQINTGPGGGGGGGGGARKIDRRPSLAKAEIYLPRVLHVSDGDVRDLDYDQDVLYWIDWTNIDLAPLVALIPENLQPVEGQLRRIRLADDNGQSQIAADDVGASAEVLRFDPVYAVRMLSDIVQNPWVAREIVERLVLGLRARGFDDQRLATGSGLIVDAIRAWLTKERDVRAEAIFRDAVALGRIQFRLRTDGRNWRMPDYALTLQPSGADQLNNKNGAALERSLFSPIYRDDFSSQDERDVAVYLDGDAAVSWWHRNVARQQYGLQGWKREKVYPDFVFAVRRDDKSSKVVVLETKGDQLEGNLDTQYKRQLLSMMTNEFQLEECEKAGELELVFAKGNSVVCDLVLMSEWPTLLPARHLTTG